MHRRAQRRERATYRARGVRGSYVVSGFDGSKPRRVTRAKADLRRAASTPSIGRTAVNAARRVGSHCTRYVIFNVYAG